MMSIHVSHTARFETVLFTAKLNVVCTAWNVAKKVDLQKEI
jgi:hypothetical protein